MPAIGQDNVIDSLKSFILNPDIISQNDSYKAQSNALDLITDYFDKQGKYDSVVHYANLAVKLAKKENNAGDVVYFSSLSGTANMNAGNYHEALEKYSEASEIAHKNGWLITESSVLNNIGAIYYYLGDKIRALEFFMKSLNIKEQKNETKKLAGALINIGGLYNQLGDYSEGLLFLERAYKNAQEQGDLYMQAKALINIGDINFSLKKYLNSRDAYRRALQLADSINDIRTKANIIVKTGDTYKALGDTTIALKYYFRSLQLSNSADYQLGIITAANATGKVFYAKKEYTKALNYLGIAAMKSEKINATSNMLESYKLLSEIYKSLPDYKKALEYHTLYTKINDSIYNAETHDRFSTVKALYEVDKKQRELDNLKLQNEVTLLQAKQSRYLLYGAAGIIVLIIFTVILIFRQHKIKNLQKTIKLEQQLLRSQINPHFIFNALTAVQRFVFEKSTIAACDYIGNFSNLIRSVLNNSTVERIPLTDEISFLNNYLNLQAIRFDKKFDFQIRTGNIKPDNVLIPPMITQPLVENAIEHGIKHLEKNGNISIDYSYEKESLKITVEDNGVGRAKSSEINAMKTRRHVSLATAITTERLLYLNGEPAKAGNIKYTDLKSESGEPAGTKVVLTLPYEEEKI